MKRLALVVVLAALVMTGCSLRQNKVITITEPTQTNVINRGQPLDWSVVSSYYASSQVELSYPLCPKQHLLRKPQVQMTAQNVAITLWANPISCSAPTAHTITVQLGHLLGHRPLTNPQLLQ